MSRIQEIANRLTSNCTPLLVNEQGKYKYAQGHLDPFTCNGAFEGITTVVTHPTRAEAYELPVNQFNNHYQTYHVLESETRLHIFYRIEDMETWLASQERAALEDDNEPAEAEYGDTVTCHYCHKEFEFIDITSQVGAGMYWCGCTPDTESEDMESENWVKDAERYDAGLIDSRPLSTGQKVFHDANNLNVLFAENAILIEAIMHCDECITRSIAADKHVLCEKHAAAARAIDEKNREYARALKSAQPNWREDFIKSFKRTGTPVIDESILRTFWQKMTELENFSYPIEASYQERAGLETAYNNLMEESKWYSEAMSMDVPTAQAFLAKKREERAARLEEPGEMPAYMKNSAIYGTDEKVYTERIVGNDYLQYATFADEDLDADPVEEPVKGVLPALICHYYQDCKGKASKQCPACKNWYCDVCYEELFLPLDSMFPDGPRICANCHKGHYSPDN